MRPHEVHAWVQCAQYIHARGAGVTAGDTATRAGKMSPETALSRITPENINLSFQTNAIGPILVCQAFEGLLAAAAGAGAATDEAPAVVANMSARVASINDNALGGWYSYRCAPRMHAAALVLRHMQADVVHAVCDARGAGWGVGVGVAARRAG